MRVVFPADYFRASAPDETFAEQAQAFARQGFAVSTFTFDSDRQFRPPLAQGDTVLYRGWMLDAAEYEAFGRAVQAAGGQLFTSPDVYLDAHHLPRWSPLLTGLTAETVCFGDLSQVEPGLRELGWDRFFIKDFVKSLKTARGSVIERPEQIGALMAEMEHFRGKIEGGICARRFEAFLPGTEQRYFVLRGRAASADGAAVPELVQECAARLPMPFYAVDVAQREDGVWRVVEVGDGQVSDLVGWTADRFVALW